MVSLEASVLSQQWLQGGRQGGGEQEEGACLPLEGWRKSGVLRTQEIGDIFIGYKHAALNTCASWFCVWKVIIHQLTKNFCIQTVWDGGCVGGWSYFGGKRWFPVLFDANTHQSATILLNTVLFKFFRWKGTLYSKVIFNVHSRQDKHRTVVNSWGKVFKAKMVTCWSFFEVIIY